MYFSEIIPELSELEESWLFKMNIPTNLFPIGGQFI